MPDVFDENDDPLTEEDADFLCTILDSEAVQGMFGPERVKELRDKLFGGEDEEEDAEEVLQ